jgi:hypothetical protein
MNIFTPTPGRGYGASHQTGWTGLSAQIPVAPGEGSTAKQALALVKN